MIDWFRSWHGAPTDAKWLMIAQRTQTNAGMVSAVAWALYDHASQASERGDVSAFDVETYAAFSGWEASKIDAIIASFVDKGLIKNNRLAAWEKRQPKREDGSADRAKEWRERKRTQTNENDQQRREEKSREDKEKKDAAPSGAHVVTELTPADVDYYRRAKQIFGPAGGGLGKKLLDAKGGNLALARSALEVSSTKAEPRDYIGAIIRGRERDETKEAMRLRGDAW